MNKIQRGIEALKQAHEEISEVANVLGINIHHQNGVKVFVETLRDLEQVPGKASYKDEGDDPERHYPIHASKVYEGVEFFCLLSRDEYKEAV